MARIVGLLLLLAIAVGAASFHFFGWWGILICAAPLLSLPWTLSWFAEFCVNRYAHCVIKDQAVVLRGARVELHGIREAEEPVASEDDDVDDDMDDDIYDDDIQTDDEADTDYQREWLYLDVTISPSGESDDALCWDPGALMLFEPYEDGRSVTDDFRSMGDIASVKNWNGGMWVEDERDIFGAARLQLHVGIRPGTERLRFVYYLLEEFGDIDLVRESAGV